MKFMLDSNIVIAIGLAVGEPVRRHMAEHEEGDFVISSIAFAEIIHGSMKGKPPPIEQLEALIDEVPVVAFDEKAARAYAGIPFRRAGYDRLIAAHALSLGLTVITGNVRDYADVPGLEVENWTV